MCVFSPELSTFYASCPALAAAAAVWLQANDDDLCSRDQAQEEAVELPDDTCGISCHCPLPHPPAMPETLLVAIFKDCCSAPG